MKKSTTPNKLIPTANKTTPSTPAQLPWVELVGRGFNMMLYEVLEKELVALRDLNDDHTAKLQNEMQQNADRLAHVLSRLDELASDLGECQVAIPNLGERLGATAAEVRGEVTRTNVTISANLEQTRETFSRFADQFGQIGASHDAQANRMPMSARPAMVSSQRMAKVDRTGQGRGNPSPALSLVRRTPLCLSTAVTSAESPPLTLTGM